jgi:hypothetical protein
LVKQSLTTNVTVINLYTDINLKNPINRIGVMFQSFGVNYIPFVNDLSNNDFSNNLNKYLKKDLSNNLNKDLSNLNTPKSLYFANSFIDLLNDLSNNNYKNIQIDIISCDFDDIRFKNEIIRLNAKYNVQINYSLDKTGNFNKGGDCSDCSGSSYITIINCTISGDLFISSGFFNNYCVYGNSGCSDCSESSYITMNNCTISGDLFISSGFFNNYCVYGNSGCSDCSGSSYITMNNCTISGHLTNSNGFFSYSCGYGNSECVDCNAITIISINNNNNPINITFNDSYNSIFFGNDCCDGTNTEVYINNCLLNIDNESIPSNSYGIICFQGCGTNDATINVNNVYDNYLKLFNILCIGHESFILMANGSYKKIIDIKRGDFINCMNEILPVSRVKYTYLNNDTYCNYCIIPKDTIINNTKLFEPLLITGFHPILINRLRISVGHIKFGLKNGLNKIYLNSKIQLISKDIILCDLQFDKPTYYNANGIWIQSSSPYTKCNPLPYELYWDKSYYSNKLTINDPEYYNEPLILNNVYDKINGKLSF